MRVLLPAPFSPMRAWTSPAATSRETLRRACVAPKRFCTPDIFNRKDTKSFQIHVQRGIEQFLDFGLLHVFSRDELRARVDPLLDLFALEVFVERHHTEITHSHRILHNKALDISVLQIENGLRA